MEEKSSADKHAAQENLESEKVECDKPLSTSGSEMVDNADSSGKADKSESSPVHSESTSGIEAVSTSVLEIPSEGAPSSDAEEKKLEPSPVHSEPTSGIEVVSTSTTSASEIPCEGALPSDAENKLEPSPAQSEPASDGEKVKSASEISCEGAAVSDAEEKKLEYSEVPCEPTIDVQKVSRSTTSEIEEKEPSTVLSASASTEIGTRSTSISQVSSEKTSSDSKEEKQLVSNETSPQPKKGFFSKLGGLLSPPKSKSKASRSKSMSPSDKKQPPVTSDKPTSTSEAAPAAPEGDEPIKKSKEKPGVLKSIKRSLTKMGIITKSSPTDCRNLVSDEEVEKPEEPNTPQKEKQIASDSKQCTCNKPVWIDNSVRSSLSLSEKPSWDGTTTTDIPSAWSGTDAFPSDSSRKPSETGENTSEEAVAGSLASSPDEQISDIKDDAELGNITTPSSDESMNVVAADCPVCKPKSEKNIESKELKTDILTEASQSMATEDCPTDKIPSEEKAESEKNKNENQTEKSETVAKSEDCHADHIPSQESAETKMSEDIEKSATKESVSVAEICPASPVITEVRAESENSEKPATED